MIIEIKEKWPEILETIKSEHEISDVMKKSLTLFVKMNKMKTMF